MRTAFWEAQGHIIEPRGRRWRETLLVEVGGGEEGASGGRSWSSEGFYGNSTEDGGGGGVASSTLTTHSAAPLWRPERGSRW